MIAFHLLMITMKLLKNKFTPQTFLINKFDLIRSRENLHWLHEYCDKNNINETSLKLDTSPQLHQSALPV